MTRTLVCKTFAIKGFLSGEDTITGVWNQIRFLGFHLVCIFSISILILQSINLNRLNLLI